MTHLSKHAQRALERLSESASLNWLIRSDIARNDANCPGSVMPNIRFNQSLEYYLGSQQVTHAADTFNSYCQSILAEILIHTPKQWDIVKPILETSKSREKYIEVLKVHRGIDGRIRDSLRDGVGCYWCREIDVISKLRNKFVHQNGHDVTREVEQAIHCEDVPWCNLLPEALIGKSIPIQYGRDDWLEADAELGHWACVHIRHHIHLMDQNLCHVHNLPHERWRPRPVSRQIASTINPNKVAAVAPGQSVILMNTKISHPKLPKPSYPKAKAEDITCSKIWRKWQELLLTEVESYYKKLNLQLIGQRAHMIGLALPHTLAGQERHWDWSLQPPEPHERHNPEIVSIRFRELQLNPYITIWGTCSVLRDFREGQEDAALEYLKDCIDKTLTLNG